MKQLTELYLALDRTTRTNEKVEALRDYFRTAPPHDAAWAAYLLSGRRLGRAVSFTQLRNYAAEVSGHPEWLVEECYHLVGDLSETLSLLVPDTPDSDPPSLHVLIEQYLRPMTTLPRQQQRDAVVGMWKRLNADQRLVFHKLLSGEFRVGVSKLLLTRALAEVAGVEPAVMAHRLSGNWTPGEQAMRDILQGGGAVDPAMPYPFMLAHPLHEPAKTLGAIEDWLLEWKWDGIRAQLIRRPGATMLWSRGDEMVAGAFPEIMQAAANVPEGTVLDGEIVAWDETQQKPMPFARLQRRLNRKNVELSLWPDVPITYIAFDVLEIDGKDVRDQSLRVRRAMLERIETGSIMRRSQPVTCASWSDAERLLSESRQRSVEGLMIKRLDSTYQPGRPTGPWWKLKVQPYSVDAVLIAAQPGHGKRAGLLTDYTFGVWDDGQLVPVAKAYSGLTDEEIARVDRFAREHTIGKYGPVRAVEPVMVFEIGFEAIQRSDRHKSGVALRFPRMLRMRDDKSPADSDKLQTLRDLLAECERRG
ncbi:MAG TPA: ATP-dependent DNA ligase [Tepidisphaeraceae bacterium]|jgi:DNA ligase-1